MGLIQATPGEMKLEGWVSSHYKILGVGKRGGGGKGEMNSHSFRSSAERMADIAACYRGRDRVGLLALVILSFPSISEAPKI